MSDPFKLDSNSAYLSWRKEKIAAYPVQPNDLFCSIASSKPSPDEQACLLSIAARYNFVFYRLQDKSQGNKAFVRSAGQLLGLHHLDGNLCSDEDNITSLQVMDMGRANTYIPYTDKPLSWHTDGYYNTDEKQIRAISMHCVRAAATGGENLLMDHEMAYIQMRDENPEYIRALSHPQAMTIPANIENGKEIRAAQTGPVFSIMGENASLHMRFSARSRNIEWRDNEITHQAVSYLKGLLSINNPYVITYRLEPGEGIICNNVLHNRSRFVNEPNQPGRLLYRARYYDRLRGSKVVSR